MEKIDVDDYGVVSLNSLLFDIFYVENLEYQGWLMLNKKPIFRVFFYSSLLRDEQRLYLSTL